MKPRLTDSAVTTSATRVLCHMASIHPGSAHISRYHFSVQPGGGNTSQGDEPKDSSAMKTMGSSRKTVTPTAMAPRPRRSGRPRRS
jgi:hypothetical protein